MKQILFIIFAVFLFSNLNGSEDLVPVLYKGRVRPLKAALKSSGSKESSSAFLENALHLRTTTEIRLLPLKEHNDWSTLEPLENVKIKNFTPYTDEIFAKISEKFQQKEPAEFSALLKEAYQEIAGKSILGTPLTFPTEKQLYAEYFISRYPIIWIILLLYALTALLYRYSFSIWFATAGFSLHTALLLTRSLILLRPPVSNMYETLLYVPWIAVASAFILRKSSILIPSAAAGASFVLLCLSLTHAEGNMEPVQAVLNSRFWLIIHVLMVVGSYGLFLLGGVLGHLYLYKRVRSKSVKSYPPLILQSLYIGTALLICGTVLGGVWAAQSWGRFWDWDPKESWAFISSCVYLLWIHAYRFRKIGELGLAIGSIVGLHAIIFTWYGVNFILGTGLHSYGFGDGGEVYYYAGAIVDLCLVGYWLYRVNKLQQVI